MSWVCAGWTNLGMIIGARHGSHFTCKLGRVGGLVGGGVARALHFARDMRCSRLPAMVPCSNMPYSDMDVRTSSRDVRTCAGLPHGTCPGPIGSSVGFRSIYARRASRSVNGGEVSRDVHVVCFHSVIRVYGARCGSLPCQPSLIASQGWFTAHVRSASNP